MDEATRQKIAAMEKRRKSIRSSLLILLFLALAGCIFSVPKIVPPFTKDSFIDLAKSVAQWRGLALDHTLGFETQTANGLRPQVTTEYYGSVPISQVEQIYKKIGLLPNDVRLTDALAEYDKMLRLIRYDSPSASVVVSPHAARLGAPLEKTNPAAARELPVAIGVMQALQERRFNWRERVNSIVTEDRRLAFRAVGAGDALLTAVSRGLGAETRKLPASTLTVLFQVAAQLDALASGLPEVLRRQVTFPYREGSQFVYWAFAAQGWRGVDALYDDPPLTTAQVLHPEKYFIQRETARRLFPAGLLRALKGSLRMDQTLGELLIRTLLQSEHSANYAADTAAGWRGDELFSFEHPAVRAAWFSAWQDEASATEFLRAYQRVLEARHRMRFDAIAEAKGTAAIARARDGDIWLLQSRGSVALLLQTSSTERWAELADKAWQDLEVESEPLIIPFELARRRVNFR